MFEIKEKPKMVERALLVGCYEHPGGFDEAEGLLRELEDLVDTLGVGVFDRMLVPLRRMQAALLMGKGKAEEVVARVKAKNLDVIIFDNELTPAQQRNWEKLSGVTVIDRHEVILDIFGKRARTREARLQVQLARLEYSLPRLARAWSHLGQQGGGIGGKGEGEAQLELDKRLIRGQIERLKGELEHVKRIRATQRKTRRRVPVPNAAIVGYTNAGKSSLLRRLTGADVLVEDRLFATLDTTTRRVELPSHQPLLLTDTVGFVRRLPHRLVEAFNATLEEAVLADFLIHLLDASQPEVFTFYQTTMEVLKELGADEKRTMTVFNKVDLVQDSSVIASLKLHFPDALFISATTGEGLPALLARLGQWAARLEGPREFWVPHDRGDVVAALYRAGNVLQVDYQESGTRLVVVLSARVAEQFASFQVEETLAGAATKGLTR